LRIDETPASREAEGEKLPPVVLGAWGNGGSSKERDARCVAGEDVAEAFTSCRAP
jgi:hypothetical protein